MTIDKAELRQLAAAAQPALRTEWKLWTSNSWRRFQGVLEPVKQDDGHPDLWAAPGVLAFVEAASPTAMLALLDEIDSLRKARSARLALQSTGEHPAPCAGSCEAVALGIEIRSLRTHAELYRLLRAQHWNDGTLCVIRPGDLTLGVQTYSGALLDEAIAALPGKEAL